MQIKSLQPIGQIKEIHDEMAVLYSVPHFGSNQTMLTDEPMEGVIQSLVYFGETDLLVEVDGSRFCIHTEKLNNVTCIIPAINAQLQTGATNKKISLGCPKYDSDVSLINIQTCYNPGVHKIYADVGMHAVSNFEHMI